VVALLVFGISQGYVSVLFLSVLSVTYSNNSLTGISLSLLTYFLFFWHLVDILIPV